MKVKSWRKVPLLLLGYDIRRWEAPGGDELYDPTLAKKWACLETNPGYGPTHLQKHSPFGFLIQWPLCFTAWWWIRPQIQAWSDGNVWVTVPGSELCPFISVGWARWDALDSCYMVPRFYIGLHSD